MELGGGAFGSALIDGIRSLHKMTQRTTLPLSLYEYTNEKALSMNKKMGLHKTTNLPAH